METLDKNSISPELITSDTYRATIGLDSNFSQIETQSKYNAYIADISKAATRFRRATMTRPLQWRLIDIYSPYVGQPHLSRRRRSLDAIGASFSGSVSDLQLSILRSEAQHDFAQISSWLNDKMRSLFTPLCKEKLGNWFRDTINHAPLHEIVKHVCRPLPLYLEGKKRPYDVLSEDHSARAFFQDVVAACVEPGNPSY